MVSVRAIRGGRWSRRRRNGQERLVGEILSTLKAVFVDTAGFRDGCSGYEGINDEVGGWRLRPHDDARSIYTWALDPSGQSV